MRREPGLVRMGESQSAVPDGVAGTLELLVGVVAIVYRQSDAELVDFLVAVGALSHRRRLVYLVDNESGRDLVRLADGGGASFEVLDGRGNGGFTGGANVGIRAALSAGCDRVLLVNTDISILRDDLIERLEQAFSQDPSCAMVSPVMVQSPRTDLVWYAGADIGRWSWIPRHPGINGVYRPPASSAPRRTSGICGCCVLIAGRLLDQIGALDEDLFSYFDDSDLSRRANRAGLHLYVWPEALIAHRKDGRRLSAIETYYFGRNPFILMRKHAAPAAWPVGVACQLCVALPVTLARSATRQARRQAWRGTLHGIRSLLTGAPVGKGHPELPQVVQDEPPAPEIITVKSCDLCGASSAGQVMTTRDRQFRLPGDFALVRCASCSLVRLSPRPSPETLCSYYPEDDYYAYVTGDGLSRYQRAMVALLRPVRQALRGSVLSQLGYPSAPTPALARSVAAAGLRRSLALQRVAGYPWEVPPYVAGGRALDVGCGNGRFLASLAELGWEVAGVDPSPAAARAALESHGVPVHVGTLESAPFESASFDFIHMRHVLEHLDLPVQSLRRAFELLRPGGWLYVETPNLDSFAARTFGRHWFPLDSPRHLWLFDSATLSGALGAAGFEPDRAWTFVMIRCASWASTYRREEELGRMVSWRPSVGRGDLCSSLVHGLSARARVHLQPGSGDIVACWARRPPEQA